MATELWIVTTHLRHLCNVVIIERVISRFLTSEVTRHIVKRICENDIYHHFQDTTTMLEGVWRVLQWTPKMQRYFYNALSSNAVSLSLAGFWTMSTTMSIRTLTFLETGVADGRPLFIDLISTLALLAARSRPRKASHPFSAAHYCESIESDSSIVLHRGVEGLVFGQLHHLSSYFPIRVQASY